MSNKVLFPDRLMPLPRMEKDFDPALIDYSKRVVVPMTAIDPEGLDFEVIVYGYSLKEFYRVPAPAPIQSLSQRYGATHIASMFDMRKHP